MKLPDIATIKTKEQAQDLAKDWQATIAQEPMSWLDVAYSEEYFTELATKFNLIDEFKENGII